VFGPVIGAMVFLLLEEGLSRFTEFQGLILGPLLLAVALYSRGGIDGVLEGAGRG
jgi:branched-chain amino acid transport system permease protein